MIHAEPQVDDRDHAVLVTADGRDYLLSPDQATWLAENLVGSTDIGAQSFATELRRAAEPPLVCRSCHDRNASHGDHCSVCLPDPLDYPKDAA